MSRDRPVARRVARPDLAIAVALERGVELVRRHVDVRRELVRERTRQRLEVVLAYELLALFACQAAVPDVFAGVIRRATVPELEHLQVLVQPVDLLVDA